MAIDKTETRKMLKFVDGKEKALRFAFAYTPKLEECELVLARSGGAGKIGKALLKESQKNPAKPKVCWGLMKVEGKRLTLSLEKKMTQIEPKLTKALKKNKLAGYLISQGSVGEDADGGGEAGDKKADAAAE